jgi:hypothetical protein
MAAGDHCRALQPSGQAGTGINRRRVRAHTLARRVRADEGMS